MMTLEQIEQALQDRSVAAVSRGSGLSKPTISAIKQKRSSKPSYVTIKALSDYLEQKQRETEGGES